MSEQKKFGEVMRLLREKKAAADPNFALRRFARMLDLSPTFVSQIERGECAPPRAENIKKIALILGGHPDELLALANKIDPELEEIIKTSPVEIPDLLRTVHGMTGDQIRSVRDFAVISKNKK